MKELIIAMIITNLLLIGQIMIDRKAAQEEKLNKQIAIDEMIPTYEIIGD